MNEKQKLQEIRRIGQVMSNVCYNLSQSDELNTRTRKTLSELCVSWDKAMAIIPDKTSRKKGKATK